MCLSIIKVIYIYIYYKNCLSLITTKYKISSYSTLNVQVVHLSETSVANCCQKTLCHIPEGYHYLGIHCYGKLISITVN